MKFLGQFLDLGGVEIRNALAPNIAGAPSAPKAGQFWYDTSLSKFVFWNGAAEIDPTNRANHTGTQLSATISDLPTVVRGYTLDTFAAPVNPLNINGQRLTAVATPIASTDAATMGYVDAAVQALAGGIISRAPVAVVSTANISTLSGLPTVDGVTLSAGQRLLLTGQSTASQNGVYVVASGAWSRPSGDSSPNGELSLGSTWLVEQGTVYAGTMFQVGAPTSGSITVGTTSVTINKVAQAMNYSAGNGLSLTGTVLALNPASGGGLTASAAGAAVDTTVARKFFGTITGTGSATQFTITHTLNNGTPIAALYDSSGNLAGADIQATSATTVVVTFGTAPASNVTYTLALIG